MFGVLMLQLTIHPCLKNFKLKQPLKKFKPLNCSLIQLPLLLNKLLGKLIVALRKSPQTLLLLHRLSWILLTFFNNLV